MRCIATVFLWLFSLNLWAQSNLDQLRKDFKSATSDSLKIELGISLTREIHKIRHNEAEEYACASKIVNIAFQLKDTLLYAKALDNLGLIYRFHQHYKEAIPLHVEAFEMIENRNADPLYKMIFANNAGLAYRYAQKFDLAIVYYMKALKIAEKENDLKNIAISSNGIGNSLIDVPGREGESMEYFKKSLEAEQKRGNSLGIAMNYLSISSHYINRHKFDTAREYLRKLLVINQDRKDEYGLAVTYENYGICYFTEGKDFQIAGEYFDKALKRFEDLKDMHKQADILNSLGQLELKLGSIQKAKNDFSKSLLLVQALGSHGLIMNNSYELSDIYEKMDNPYQALNYLKKGKLYEDSIKLSDQEIKIAALIEKSNLQKKENQIQLLQKDRELQESLLQSQDHKLDQRRGLIVLLFSTILFVLAILFMQYRNSRARRQTNLLLQKEEQDKVKAIYERNLAQTEILVTRLQIKPHFIFNCLNAIKYLIQSEQNQKAMKYLVIFSRYTRMVLETSQKQDVPLTEELMLTRYYLTLEENRFENDFTHEIKSPPEDQLRGITIPPLLLQPFIENAIWHGLLPSKNEKKELTIEIRCESGITTIIIDDNGVGRKARLNKPRNKTHQSMGIQITKDRINLYNRSNPSSIDWKVIDKANEDGSPAGTRIIIEVLNRNQALEKAESTNYL